MSSRVPPLVSVVIPCYNHGAYLSDAITSVLSQSMADLEVIVVDDGSTDNTASVAQSFGGSITYIRKANGGTASALNVGLDRARGTFWAWLSADDSYEPNKLWIQLEFLRYRPDVGLCYTDFWVVGEHGERRWIELAPTLTDRTTQNDLLFDRCYINGSTVLIRRKCLDVAGRFDESMPYAHDYDMWLRIGRDTNFGHIPLPLLRYRIHTTNASHHADALSDNPRVISKAKEWFGEAFSRGPEDWRLED